MNRKHVAVRKFAGAVVVGAGLTLGATPVLAGVSDWQQVAQLSAEETMDYAQAVTAGTPEAVAAFLMAHPTSTLVAELLARVPQQVAMAAIDSLPAGVMAQVNLQAVAATTPAVAAHVAESRSITTGSISTDSASIGPAASADGLGAPSSNNQPQNQGGY